MCAKYSLPPFDWLKLSHHLVSGESTLHEVTLFEARWRIFLPTAESCAALFCCRLVGNNTYDQFAPILGETDNNMGQVCQLFRSVGHCSNVMYQCDFKMRKFCRDTNGATLFIRIFCCFVLYKAEDIVNKKI